MSASNQGSALFSNCDGFLSELSATDEAVLAGGHKGYGRGSRSGSSRSKSSRSGSSRSGGGRGFKKVVFVPFYPKYRHYC